LAEQAEPVTEAAFGDDARCIAPSQSPIVSCPVIQELRHEDRVVAFGAVDADCVLVPDTQLAPRFSAVTLRNLISDAADIPCWAWDNGALTEAVLGKVSLYTLVWETRMTGYAAALSVALLLFALFVPLSLRNA